METDDIKRRWATKALYRVQLRMWKTLQTTDLTLEDILTPDKCPILGITLDYTGRGLGDNACIDRKDNEKGYVKGNVWVISKSANGIKSTVSLRWLERSRGQPFDFLNPVEREELTRNVAKARHLMSLLYSFNEEFGTPKPPQWLSPRSRYHKLYGHSAVTGFPKWLRTEMRRRPDGEAHPDDKEIERLRKEFCKDFKPD